MSNESKEGVSMHPLFCVCDYPCNIYFDIRFIFQTFCCKSQNLFVPLHHEFIDAGVPYREQ